MNEHVPGTRIAERLLTRPAGATMDELIEATGGPKYNLLRGLEARGYAVRREKTKGQPTRYFATPPAAPAFAATITSKGQVTVPREVREALGLRGGARVSFAIADGGTAIMRPVAQSVQRLFGILGKPPRSATVAEMDIAIRRHAVDRYLRAVGGRRR